MPKGESILSEVNLFVESIKHFAGVEHVYLFKHKMNQNVFRILVLQRNRKQISIIVNNAKPIDQAYKSNDVWQKIGENHLEQ